MGLPILSELITVLLSNPLLAYFTILFVLLTDTFLSGLAFPNGIGVAGYIISNVLTAFGVTLVITSFHILFLVAITPIVIFVLKKSGRPNGG